MKKMGKILDGEILAIADESAKIFPSKILRYTVDTVITAQSSD